MQIQLALSDDINPGLFSSNSNPYGISFTTWTTKWWQWYLQIPNSIHPFEDKSGKNCGINQEGPVWYLTGGKGTVVRNCDIPSDKAILFPILNTEYSFVESPAAKTEQDLRTQATGENQSPVPILKATIDGRDIKNIDSYRVTSGLFNVTYSEDPVFGVAPNSHSQAVSDGWYIMLEPLKPGMHDLNFIVSQQGENLDKVTVMNVTYSLTIK